MSGDSRSSPIDSDLRAEVFALTLSVCDDSNSVAEMQRLSNLLAQSHRARDIYREAVALHVCLQFRYETASGGLAAGDAADAPPLVQPATRRGRPGRSWRESLLGRLGLSLALVPLLLAVVGAAYLLLREREVQPGPKNKPGSVEIRVACLQLEGPCVWGPGHADLRDGSGISSGRRIELQQGKATFSYESGAILDVESPAVLHLLSPSSVRVESGRIFARVPPPAAGFTVITPTARIIDLGTEFGVHVLDSLRTHVGVFEGSAECFALDGGGVEHDHTRMTAGQAMSVDRSGIKPLADFDFASRRAELFTRKAAAYWRFEEAVPLPPEHGGTQRSVIGDFSGHGRSLDYWPGGAEGIGAYQWSDEVPPRYMFRGTFSGGSRSFDCASLDADKAGVLASDHALGSEEMLERGFTLEGFFKTRGDLPTEPRMMLVYQGEKLFSYELMLNDVASGSCSGGIHGTVGQELVKLQATVEGKNFADGMWHYFVARYRPASPDEPGELQLTVVDETQRFYSASTAVPAGFVISNSNRPLLLGRLQYFRNESPKAHFVGLLDEIRITDIPLADDDLIGRLPAGE